MEGLQGDCWLVGQPICTTSWKMYFFSRENNFAFPNYLREIVWLKSGMVQDWVDTLIRKKNSRCCWRNDINMSGLIWSWILSNMLRDAEYVSYQREEVKLLFCTLFFLSWRNRGGIFPCTWFQVYFTHQDVMILGLLYTQRCDDFIILVIDRFSKMARFMPCIKTNDAYKVVVVF